MSNQYFAGLKSPDPVVLAKAFWPHITFYREQQQIMNSVRDHDETYVRAGNMLGKDFVAGWIALWYFLINKEVRVITTSVKDDHLRVLWGEIGRYIQTSKYPLTADKGGPLIIKHREIRKVVKGEECKISYLLGMVSERGEGMAGHHAAKTLVIIDEASGVDDIAYNQSDTWAKKKLIIGNPNPCNNFFRKNSSAGDLVIDGVTVRKVIKIKAEDSPNVRLAQAQLAQGKKPTNEIVCPGVITWNDYVKRRATWDAVRQCVGLDAEFYQGGEVLLFPTNWLDRAALIAQKNNGVKRVAKAIGVDPAEGGDSTTFAVVDELGVIELYGRKTPDTSVITGEVIALMNKYDVDPTKVLFDRGGGGKEHADRLRQQGYAVKTISFGEPVTKNISKNKASYKDRLSHRDSHYTYFNKRSEMYGELSVLLDPGFGDGFGIPGELVELRRQLAVIPKVYDSEGRLMMLPKNKKKAGSRDKTLIDIIGHSPDEADALVLAVHAMRHTNKAVLIEAF